MDKTREKPDRWAGDAWEPWSVVARSVAGWDADRLAVVGAWDLREVLLAYEALMRDRALTVFRHEQLIFALGATKDTKPPVLPMILRDDI